MTHDKSMLLCGIDGGGTSTKVVVCDAEGNVLHAFETGSINHYGTGLEKTRDVFAGISANLQSRFGTLPGTLFVGDSALDETPDAATIQTITGNVFGSSKVIFHSDAYIALLGFALGQPGAILISGTGSMACGIDTTGKYHVSGGWGQVLGDEGSGYHLALMGIRAALQGNDGISEPTQLTERVMHFFGVPRLRDLIEKICHPPAEKSIIAAFAPEVARAAHEGDVVALRIIDDTVRWLHKLALSIARVCPARELGYYGSVLMKNEVIRTKLGRLLGNHDIFLLAPRLKPAAGALIGAFSQAGLPVTDTVIANLEKY